MNNHTPAPWHACCIHQTPHYVFGPNADDTVCRIEINDPALDSYEEAAGIVTLEQARANARLIAASPTMLAEMLRYLPILERLESMPATWAELTEGTGIATANGYREALVNAQPPVTPSNC